MLNKIIEDLDVYAVRKGYPKILCWLTLFIYPVLWAIVTYRFGYWVCNNLKIQPIKTLLYIVYFIIKRFVEILFAIEISEKAHIGKGIYIAHTGGLVIAHDSIIGDYPSFHQYMTIGGAGRGEKYGNPTIGDRVYFGAGCQVIGKIKVGDDVIIGANAVVLRDVPDKASVAGIPANVLNFNGSHDFVHYRNKDICE